MAAPVSPYMIHRLQDITGILEFRKFCIKGTSKNLVDWEFGKIDHAVTGHSRDIQSGYLIRTFLSHFSILSCITLISGAGQEYPSNKHHFSSVFHIDMKILHPIIFLQASHRKMSAYRLMTAFHRSLSKAVQGL